MGMKAVIHTKGSELPCIVYWTGRVNFHVGVVTYCKRSQDATSAGVLQVPDDIRCCSACEVAVEARDFPKTR